MKHSKRVFALLIAVLMMACILPVQVFAMKENGWNKINDTWYYFVDGIPFSNGWKKIGGAWYFFYEDGRMAANDYFISWDYGVDRYSTYVVGKSGAMVTKAGWFQLKYSDGYSHWFYLKKGGLAVQGWKKIDGKWYYFGKGIDGYMPGRMSDGYGSKIDGKVYVFNKSGALVTSTGWYKIKSPDYAAVDYYWYYLKKDGVATTGWKKLGGKWYYFDKSRGVMYTGKCTIDGKVYEFDKNGVCLNPYAYD